MCLFYIYSLITVGLSKNLAGSNTPALLQSNVVYRFSYSCDVGLTYSDNSTDYTVTSAK